MTTNSEMDIQVDPNPVTPGTSRQLKIRVPGTETRRVHYVVKGEYGEVLQEKEFKLLPGIDEVDWYLNAPKQLSGGSLHIRVSVDDSHSVERSIEVSD